MVQVAPFVEQVGAEAGAADRLEELLGDDGVGIDVGAIQRRHVLRNALLPVTTVAGSGLVGPFSATLGTLHPVHATLINLLDPAYLTLQTLVGTEAGLEAGPTDDTAVLRVPLSHGELALDVDLSGVPTGGLPVISDKPATATLDEALELRRIVRDSGAPYALTYTYSGYPMVHEARVRVAAGEIGKVRTVQGTGQFISPNELEVTADDGETTLIAFEQCIIAAGSQAVKLPGFPWEDPRIMDSTDALNLADIPGSLLVVGGGIIGLEMATAAAGDVEGTPAGRCSGRKRDRRSRRRCRRGARPRLWPRRCRGLARRLRPPRHRPQQAGAGEQGRRLPGDGGVDRVRSRVPLLPGQLGPRRRHPDLQGLPR